MGAGWDLVVCVGLSPPAGAGAVWLARGAPGEMADSAAIVLGWKILGAAMVLDT